MRFLEVWIDTPLAQAMGWTLLHSLWEGALIAATLAAALAAIRSTRARYAAACVAMLVMVGGIGLTLICLMPEGAHGVHSPGFAAFPAWNSRTDLEFAGTSSAGFSALVPWLVPFWLLGVCIFAFRQVASWISVRRLRGRGVCCAPERWQKELTRLSARLRVSRPVLLLESCLADAPMLLGHIRPVILMPLGLVAGLPPEQIEAVLLHELAHICRCDYLAHVVQRWVECLLFYHPAFWWISRVICTERENCCDDLVVATTGSPKDYAEALAALEQNRCSGREAAVAASGGSLVKRIHRLLYPRESNSPWTPLLAGGILITTAVMAFAEWPASPRHRSSSEPPRAEALTAFATRPAAASQQSSTAPQRHSQSAETSPHAKWVNGEVVYIIGDEERAAFKKLTSEEAREKFIEEFWEKRNPNPGGRGNVFKEEFYRRVAYANKHFANSRTPGWKTDRGGMYISYGPPDEITQRGYGPAPGSHVPYGIQVWTYRHVNGVGDNLSVQFMDTTGRGDFELPPGQSSFKPVRRPDETQPRKDAYGLGPQAMGSGEASTYDKWLSEEVAYIISDEERIAFKKLTTDEERKMFVEQFWERRNANPGSAENAFKEEYYRRIAYSKEHFATGRPGWKTDRGRIYIVYGPPDEIDSHSAAKPFPFEEWKYHYIEDLGPHLAVTFALRSGSDEYQLVSPPWKQLPAKAPNSH